MCRILIVDDEPRYCEEMSRLLEAGPHVVATASSAREAVDLGARFRPEVLVADWLLKDRMHGLHVSQVLQLVVPEMRTIVISGFDTEELRREASSLDIFEFLAKPFEPDQFLDAVQRAAAAGGPPIKRACVAVFEVDRSGRIRYMNEHGSLLLRQVGIDEASSLDDIFVNEDFPDLDAAIERWIVVHPAGDQRIRWHLRTQSARVKDSRFIAVLRPDDPHYLGLRLVEMLLGTSPGRKPNPLGLSGNVLVIESDSVNRQLALAMMEGADVGCYVVGTIDEAMRILQADQSIPVVVLDEQAVAGGDATLPESIRRIREVAPDSQLVGVGEPEAECRFIKSGIRVFVSRPWTVKRLAAALHG